MSTPTHTPGPWNWFVNTKTKQAYLATEHSGRQFVMCFKRAGMQRAQPVFQVHMSTGGVMWPLFDPHSGITTEPDHNGEVEVIHPDAVMIAAAPTLYAALRDLLDAYRDLAESGDCGFWDPDVEERYTAARAALASASPSRHE